MSPSQSRHPSSYRDPAGFVFEQGGVIYRQVNNSYRPHYEHFMTSGLYDRLQREELIVSHEEVEGLDTSNAYKIIKPQQIPFISYPYEWCHAQLHAAASLTIKILRISLEYGMILKDASPYNIQFIGSKPIFIDSLSWEIHSDQTPWIGYRQFCEFFLATLALSYYRQVPVNRTLRAWPEGLPLDIITRLLPTRTRLNIDLLLHLHLHVRITKKSSTEKDTPNKQRPANLRRIIDSLEKATHKLASKSRVSTWTNYYQKLEDRGEYLSIKDRLVREWLQEMGPAKMTLDAGCNEGHFSKLLREIGHVIAIDADAQMIDLNYQNSVSSQQHESRHEVIFLSQDICDLSENQGLGGRERIGFSKRATYEVVLCLALIHHLIIGRQVPLQSVVEIFSQLSNKWLIIEYVPEDDPWSEAIRLQKPGLTHRYDQLDFENALKPYFTVVEKSPLLPTGRWLYKLRK